MPDREDGKPEAPEVASSDAVSPPGSRVRLVLVGPGHTHLEVIRRQILQPLPEVELTVVAPGERHHYSGMVPGYLHGAYDEEQISVRVPDLVERAGGRVVLEPAVGLDPKSRRVHLRDGSTVAYDFVSVAVGSTTAGFDRSRIAEHAQLVKPLTRAVRLRERLVRLGHEPETELPVAVVGAGAAGVEVALAARAVLGDRGRVGLFDAGDEILPGFSNRFRLRARAVLAARGIEVHTGEPVTEVGPKELLLGDGTRHPARLTIWLTGAVAYPWLRESGLPVDDRGFLRVDPALRSIGDPRVFAAGDCATLETAPDTPKAGVYAVRHGPVLWQSLKATITGGTGVDFPEYEPQEGFLALLNTGDGKALVRWKGLVAHGRLAWWLKDWIDRRFIQRYQRFQDA